MNKTIKKELEEFVEKSHWLVCDCDLEGGECRMEAILPFVEEALDKAYQQGREDERKETSLLHADTKAGAITSDVLFSNIDNLNN